MDTRTQGIVEEIAFLVKLQQEDESVILARAVREGIHLLYRNAVIEAYLLGQLPRERALTELGPETLANVEFQRDAIKKDVEWGLKDD